MIRQKKKKCSVCNEERYIFSKGRCQNCSNINNSLKNSKSYIKPITDKKKKEKQAQRERRDIYFEHHIKRCIGSEESLKPIANPNRSNICHIFDKGRHPSLEDNLDNYLYLSLKEHEKFDHLLYNHEFKKLEKEFENSWPKVCKRIKLLISLCEENTNFYREVKKYTDEYIKS